MVNPHKGLVFAGIFVVAFGVTSYLPRLLQTPLHHNQSSSDADDDASTATGVRDEVPASGAVTAGTRADTSPARILQAVRDSLRRNDLASADVLLRAARALDIDNPQAIALQHDLDARTTQSAPSASSAKGAVSVQAEPPPVTRTSRVETRPVQKHERLQHPSRARSPAPRAVLQSRDSADSQPEVSASKNIPAEPVVPVLEPAAKPAARPSTITETAPESAPESVPQSVPQSIPQAVRAPDPVVAAAPVAQSIERPAPAPVPVVESSQGPKSRAQVRAELEHARADGSLPRFGNPDPAGPAVPTISKPLAAAQNR